jgi:hypothetical protein
LGSLVAATKEARNEPTPSIKEPNKLREGNEEGETRSSDELLVRWLYWFGLMAESI